MKARKYRHQQTSGKGVKTAYQPLVVVVVVVVATAAAALAAVHCCIFSETPTINCATLSALAM